MKLRNWRTSLTGWAVLALTGAQIVADPKRALEEHTINSVVQGLVGVGLIKAADKQRPPEEKGDK